MLSPLAIDDGQWPDEDDDGIHISIPRKPDERLLFGNRPHRVLPRKPALYRVHRTIIRRLHNKNRSRNGAINVSDKQNGLHRTLAWIAIVIDNNSRNDVKRICSEHASGQIRRHRGITGAARAYADKCKRQGQKKKTGPLSSFLRPSSSASTWKAMRNGNMQFHICDYITQSWMERTP